MTPETAAGVSDEGAADMRRLLPLVAAIALLDAMFFAAIAPVLPHYAQEFALSKSAAGVLTASYAAGTLVASIPGGWLAIRIGVRPTLLLGLALLCVSSFAFAFADSVVTLDLARFISGVGGAFSWAAALTWLTAVAPEDHRGEVIGTALAAAIAGVLLGPILGGAASVLGVELVFAAVGLSAMVLLAGTSVVRARTPAPRSPEVGQFLQGIRRPDVATAFWLTALPALFAGALEVLVPLRLSDLGATSAIIGAVFLVAAGIEAIATRRLGKVSDRLGRLAPIRSGLILLAVSAALLPWPAAVVLVGAIMVSATLGLGFIWAPAGALLSEAGEAAGIELGFAFALFNLAWSVGAMVGGAAGARLAQASTDAVPYLLVAGLCLATLAVISRGLPTNSDPTPDDSDHGFRTRI